MATKNNHRPVGLKDSTRSISYNVRTTKYNTIRTQYDVRGMQSKLKMTSSPMQKPDSVTGQACLSSAPLTAHNILLSAGVISRCTAVILPIVFRQEHISFYPKIAIILCFRTAVLLRTKSNTDEFGEVAT